jgi:hypothetical protein
MAKDSNRGVREGVRRGCKTVPHALIVPEDGAPALAITDTIYTTRTHVAGWRLSLRKREAREAASWILG